ncbi:MAG: biotin--[acetyl-CoA-carboxylase] ligase [bacterium]|nr:biotin--[acetyl-CoA-carboxylase] ligase [bacterium]
MPPRFSYDQVDSTNERAFAALASGDARHGDIHVARAQTAGRGRHGSPWVSEDGGLYLSVVLLPKAPPPPAALTVAGGLAVLDAVRDLGLEGAHLDWPNDLMCGAAKLAGVLSETRGLDPTAPHYVLGVGLNVTQTEFPTPLSTAREVTSLARLGITSRVDEAEAALTARLVKRTEQVSRRALAALATDYLAAIRLPTGSGVRVRVGTEDVEGELQALDLVHGLSVLPAGRADGALRRIPLELVRALR